MRFKEAFVASFGRTRDRSYPMGPGLNVFYGPNESGKTTLMEFIRSTVSPNNKRKQYPEREKSDSGRLVIEEDGAETILTLKGRNVTGDLPEGLSMDPSLYRSVFAMNPSDLDGSDVLKGGEIRTRFLTVPGGSGMPAAMEEMDDRISEILGKSAASKSQYNDVCGRIKDTDERIAELKANAERYTQITEDLEAARRELEELQRASGARAEDRRVSDLYKANEGNYESLRKLKTERGSIGEFVPVDDQAMERHSELTNAKTNADSLLETCNRRLEEEKDALCGADPRAVTARASEIEALPGRVSEDVARRDQAEALRKRIGDRRAESPKPVAPVTSKRPIPTGGILLAVIGVVVAAAGLMLGSSTGIAVTAAGAVILVAGAAWAVLGRKSQPRPEPAPVQSDTSDIAEMEESLRELESKTRKLDEDVMSIMADLGLAPHGTPRDVQQLTAVLTAARAYAKSSTEQMKARLDSGTAETNLLRFLQPYGGEEGYIRAVETTRRAADLDRRIESLSGAIRSAGLDPDSPECPVAEVDDDSGRIGELQNTIGRLTEQRSAVLDTEELDALMDERARLNARKREILRESAVAILARHIAQQACDDIYSTVQPGVMSTADRYLGMMTCGRYGLDLDPRRDGLAVRSGSEIKEEGQWSTGLRAQVLLSLKLAVARELKGGRMPIILDDVLLPFDSDRKRGAIRALAELSSEMQVLLFTCDAETRDIAMSTEGADVVSM